MKTTEITSLGRNDSPICLIHFSHPYVYIESSSELEFDNDSSSNSSNEDLNYLFNNSACEKSLYGPSSDLLTQILFPDLKCTCEVTEDLNTVLKMLRETWQRSRPNSAGAIQTLRQQYANKLANKRHLSAPETRIRRFTIRATVEREEDPTDRCNSSRSAPSVLLNHPNNNMCTDSVSCQNEMVHNCYCHGSPGHPGYLSNEYKFSCKVNFEETTTTTTRHAYNCNYIDRDYNYYGKLIPRYSSIPRTLSMLNNCSSPSTSTSSVSSEEDCQSLADSLEDISPSEITSFTRLAYDDKPVRGAPPLLPHRPAPRIPGKKAETFFVPLSSDIDEENNDFLLPPMLREKLEKRKQELENRPKIRNNNNALVPRNNTNNRTRRILGTKFQRFECIPEEYESRKNNKAIKPLSRTYVPRERNMSSGNRGLQAIVRGHETKVGLQESCLELVQPGFQGIVKKADDNVLAISSSAGLQGIIQDSSNNIIMNPARGKQAMSDDQDLVDVTTGWVNFYVLRGEETVTTTTTASSETTSTVTSSGRRTWSRERGMTQVSVSRASTVRVQQPLVTTRPIVLGSSVRSRRADSEPDMRARKFYPSLPRLPHTGDGISRLPAREKPAILPSLSKRSNNVPLIRVKQASSSSASDFSSDSAAISLPALPAAVITTSTETPKSLRNRSTTSSDPSPRPIRRRIQTRTSSTSKSMAVRANGHSKQVVQRTVHQEQLKSAVIAENSNAPPGMWSVTVSGLCPQPEMEVRLVFPPTETSENPAIVSDPSFTTPAITHRAGEDILQASPNSTSNFAIAFKNDQKSTPQSPQQQINKGNRSKSSSPVTSPKRRGSRFISSPPIRDNEMIRTQDGAEILTIQQDDDPIAPEVNDPTALQALMWPEMEAIIEEKVSGEKGLSSRQINSATAVERLRGGEDDVDLTIRGSAITRRKKRSSVC